MVEIKTVLFFTASNPFHTLNTTRNT